jgi:hypothetical protein
VVLSTGLALHAFDRSLNGGWGVVLEGEKMEIIRFNTNEIIIMNTLLRAHDYTESDDTIYIDDFNNDSVIIQYYRLAANKLLFILLNTDNPEQSITFILTKL